MNFKKLLIVIFLLFNSIYAKIDKNCSVEEITIITKDLQKDKIIKNSPDSGLIIENSDNSLAKKIKIKVKILKNSFQYSASNDEEWDKNKLKLFYTFLGHRGAVNWITLSKNGKFLLSGSDDKTIKLWDTLTSRLIKTFKGHSGSVSFVTFSPNDKFIFSWSKEDHSVKIWNVKTGELASSFFVDSNINAISFSKNRRYFISGADNGKIKLWDIVKGLAIRTFDETYKTPITAITFSKDGKYILTANNDGKMRLWSFISGEDILTFQGHSQKINSVAFSKNGKYIVSGGEDKKIKVWDSITGKLLNEFNGDAPIKCVKFSNSGKYVVAGDNQGMIEIFDLTTKKLIHKIKAHNGPVNFITFYESGESIFTAGGDKTIKLWK